MLHSHEAKLVGSAVGTYVALYCHGSRCARTCIANAVLMIIECLGFGIVTGTYRHDSQRPAGARLRAHKTIRLQRCLGSCVATSPRMTNWYTIQPIFVVQPVLPVKARCNRYRSFRRVAAKQASRAKLAAECCRLVNRTRSAAHLCGARLPDCRRWPACSAPGQQCAGQQRLRKTRTRFVYTCSERNFATLRVIDVALRRHMACWLGRDMPLDAGC